ncbi:MAG: DUF4240 domain-containing protein [Propioniciclava sp.]|uniref:DUF4240 domain-containing protein n=1 Tax=Propioniciclava sp. TaxID=2038686 RepID=UPI0039E633F5
MREFAATDGDWVRWKHSFGSGFLSLMVSFREDHAKPRLRVRHDVVEVDLCVSVRRFEGLSGARLTARAVELLEEVLVSVQRTTSPPCPWFLGRTKRECEAGYSRPERAPEPRDITIVPQPRLMSAAEFWRRVDEHRLPSPRPSAAGARFSERCRLLMAGLDTERHRACGESVLGFISDDVWEDILVWLVLQGERKYHRFVKDEAALVKQLAVFEEREPEFDGSWLAELEA